MSRYDLFYLFSKEPSLIQHATKKQILPTFLHFTQYFRCQIEGSFLSFYLNIHQSGKKFVRHLQSTKTGQDFKEKCKRLYNLNWFWHIEYCTFQLNFSNRLMCMTFKPTIYLPETLFLHNCLLWLVLYFAWFNSFWVHFM